MVQREWTRFRPRPRLSIVRFVSLGSIPILSAAFANVDPSRAVSLDLLGALLMAVLVLCIRPSGIRGVPVAWLILALAAEAYVAVLGTTMTLGIAVIALLVTASPMVWRKVIASRATTIPVSDQRHSPSWTNGCVTQPCLTK